MQVKPRWASHSNELLAFAIFIRCEYKEIHWIMFFIFNGFHKLFLIFDEPIISHYSCWLVALPSEFRFPPSCGVTDGKK